MKIALVHDYLVQYGGAERVLEALCEAYPNAPIYTAFVDKNSTAYEHFKNRKSFENRGKTAKAVLPAPAG